jgi:hypothetical protein
LHASGGRSPEAVGLRGGFGRRAGVAATPPAMAVAAEALRGGARARARSTSCGLLEDAAGGCVRATPRAFALHREPRSSDR